MSFRIPLALLIFLLPVVLGAAVAAPVEPVSPFDAPSISIDEVQVGQKGYGVTVFQGTTPERFDVEVVGVMRNLAPGLSYVLVKLTGHGLEKSGVAAGMSGSPVYLDDRLLGAVAFGWPFSNEAIGGVTPIAAMRRVGLDGPSGAPAPESLATGRPIVPLADLLARRIPSDLLSRELASLSARFSPEGTGVAGAVVWSATGFGEHSVAALRQGFGSTALALAGRADGTSGSSGPALGVADLVPGGAVTGVILDGDFRLGATGTVTDRGGDSLLAFGHAFLGAGPVSIPMAPAEVVTILSNQYNSFKIANLGPIVGAVEQDRRSGIEGRIGAVAPMFPIVVKVHGEREHEYRMRIADVPDLVAGMVGTAALASLEAASRTAGGQSLDLSARFRIAGQGDLEVAQSFDGDGATNEAVGYLLSIASYLAQNDLERLHLEGVEISFDQASAPRGLTIDGAHAERTVIRPGERVRLQVDLRAFRGATSRRTLDLAMPKDLGPGRYTVWVGDGASVDAARLQLEPANPETLPQALALLGSFHTRRELAAIVSLPRPGVVAGGATMPQLPGSVRSLWGAGGAGLGTPFSGAVVARAALPLDAPASGLVRLDLEVRAPGGEPPEGGADSTEATPTEIAEIAAPAPAGRAIAAATQVPAATVQPHESRERP
jgi:hypothetical protein